MVVIVAISVIPLDSNGNVLNKENLVLDKGTNVEKIRALDQRFDLYRVEDGRHKGKYFCSTNSARAFIR